MKYFNIEKRKKQFFFIIEHKTIKATVENIDTFTSLKQTIPLWKQSDSKKDIHLTRIN